MLDNETWRPGADLQTLRRRARFLQQIRQWFAAENVLEVETPQLNAGATTDPHIDSFGVVSSAATTATDPSQTGRAQGMRSLRTSAEFHMKRLLASGYGDIYELGKVFRVDECGRHHNPEFTMLEWYRVGYDHYQLIDDVELLLKSLHCIDLNRAAPNHNAPNYNQVNSDNDFGPSSPNSPNSPNSPKNGYPGMQRISYRDLWKLHCDIDIARADCAELASCIQRSGCDVPDSIVSDFDTLLDLGMSSVICNRLATDRYTCIVDYPASQASLARIDRADAGFPVACRFEFYFGPVELANGYHELTDAAEQRERFDSDNRQRQTMGKAVMPVDEGFLAALQSGMPDCAGVAIGVDRLLMVLLPEVKSIQQVLAFNWNNAW